MDYLETLGTGNNKIEERRQFFLSKEFSAYKKFLTQLKKTKKQLLDLEEQIYGSVSDINIFTTIYFRGRSRGEIVIVPRNNQIIVNEFLRRLYGNGCIMRDEGIESRTYSFNDIGLNNEKILIALRRLFKSKMDESYKIQKDHEKAIIEKFKKEEPEIYKKGVRPTFDFEQTYGIDRKYKLEEFFLKLIPNIDIVIMLLNYLESKKDVGESEIINIIKHIKEFLPIIPKSDALYSESECIKDIKSRCSSIKYSNVINEETSCEEALEVFNIIKEENKKAQEELENHPEYEEIKKEYFELLKKVQEFERKYLCY